MVCMLQPVPIEPPEVNCRNAIGVRIAFTSWVTETGRTPVFARTVTLLPAATPGSSQFTLVVRGTPVRFHRGVAQRCKSTVGNIVAFSVPRIARAVQANQIGLINSGVLSGQRHCHHNRRKYASDPPNTDPMHLARNSHHWGL